MTGLTGAYDFAVGVTPVDYQAMMLRSAVLRGTNIMPEARKLLVPQSRLCAQRRPATGWPEAGIAQGPA